MYNTINIYSPKFLANPVSNPELALSNFTLDLALDVERLLSVKDHDEFYVLLNKVIRLFYGENGIAMVLSYNIFIFFLYSF